MEELFASIYRSNGWSGEESVSGTGSDLAQTEVIRRELPGLLREYGIRSLLDIPCGDYWWMSHIKDMPEIEYVGADIVQELIWENQYRYPGVDFRNLDITESELPKVDLILARDIFGHFSQEDWYRAHNNIKKSGSRYLLATTFPAITQQRRKIATGFWRPINMELLLGYPPLAIIDEGLVGTDGKPTSKSLGLWEINHG